MAVADLAALAKRQLTRGETYVRPLPHVGILRALRPTALEAAIYDPVLILVLEGRKETVLGTDAYPMGVGQCLLVSHDLPVVARIVKSPYLALIFDLQLSVLRELHEADAARAEARSLAVHTCDRKIVDALHRYLELGADAPVLGPLISRELHYRLATSPFGGMLHELIRHDSQASAIARARCRSPPQRSTSATRAPRSSAATTRASSAPRRSTISHAKISHWAGSFKLGTSRRPGHHARMHDVVIAGAGPTGMMLAGELALAGIDVAIVERRPTPELAGSRAGGLHARTIEVFDQRGIAGRFLAEGKPAQVAAFAGTPLDLSDFPTRHPYGLALWQNHIERILAGWIAELPVTIYRDREVTAFTQDADGVDVGELRARYLVGCDGGRSVIRKIAGIDFAGSAATTSMLIAEVELAAEPPWGMRRDQTGTHGFSKLDGGTIRVVVTERTIASGAADLGTLREALIAVFGSDFGVHTPTWISRFTDMARQAVRYRDRRVLLAGDAAHVHSPVGGQGLNIGVQDAVNLGWKLARVIRGTSQDDLLDSYHRERHPVAARVLRHTLAQVALHQINDRTKALTEVLGELMRMDEPRRRFAGMMSGLDVHYDLGAGHPLLGRRMPDLDLVTADGPVRVFTLLRAAQPVLLDLGAGLAPPAIRATCAGPWELPVIGMVSAPRAVLIRPDGYVAWVDDGALPGWFR